MKPKQSLNNLLSNVSTKLNSSPQEKLNPAISLCVMTQFFPPDYAPTGQLIDELTQFLGLQGVEVDVFSGQPGYAFRASSAPSVEWRNQVRIKRSRVAQLWPQRIRGKAINGLLYFIRAGLFLLKNHRQYNVLLLTTAPPFLQVLGYLAHRLLNLPYICLIYDLYPDIAVELGVVSSSHWLARFWRSVNCHVWRQSKGIIVLSSSMKQRIVGYCPEVEHKTSVVHSWSDPQWIVPIPKQRNWFAWKHDLVEPFTVLYSGNMGRCHDMDTILETIEQLKREPIRFVFIGGGAKRSDFFESVQRLELSNCTFLPYQDKDVLPYSLTACDLALVSISAGMENLVAPSKLYSALSAGHPIAAVCPKDSYLNQLITEAGCGSTFENNDSRGLAEFIRFLCRDAKAAEQMGGNGRDYLKQNFAPNIITQQYLKVLQQAVSVERNEEHFSALSHRTPATSSTPES